MKIGKNSIISPKASIYGHENIEIGDNVRIDDFCILSGGSGLKIGNHVHIACFAALFAGSGIVIDDYVGLSARVTLYSESDDYSGESMTNPQVDREFRKKMEKGKITIGRHALIGAYSAVMPGVTIGDGAAVGMFSMIKDDLAPWTIYAGVPAVKIKDRKRDILDLEKEFMKAHV